MQRLFKQEVKEREGGRPIRISSVRNQAEYVFWHGLLQEVAYSRIPRAARLDKHRAVAEWMERLAGDRIADRAELVAHHYLLALAHARSSAAHVDVEELTNRARRHLATAGNRAMRMNVMRAEALFQRAIELCPPGHPDRPQLLQRVAAAAYESRALTRRRQDSARLSRRVRRAGTE